VVYNEVNVSGQGAGITLEFEGGERLTLELREGTVRIDGTETGRYTPGGTLDRAWRELLAGAIATDNGGVARLLAAWDPPSGLEGDAAAAARTLGDRLRGALTAAPGQTGGATGAAGGVVGSLDPDARQSVLQLILENPDRAREIALLLADQGDAPLDLRVGRDVRIGADERIEGSLLVVDGDLELVGTVEGDVMVLGGNVHLGEAARIGGDLRSIDGTVRGSLGAVGGSLAELSVPQPPSPPEAPSVADIRAEVERGIRDGMRDAGASRSSSRSPGFFRNLASGIGGLLQSVVTFALLLGIGMGILYFFPRHFEVVARTVAHVPGRAFAVGWAGALLSPFAWIAGIVLLAVSIIGIPALILWLPLFWVALASAFLLGFLAVCRNVGTWWVRRGEGYQPQGLDTDQPAARLGVGLAIFMLAFVAASILQIGGSLFNIFQGFFVVAGSFVAVNATVMGFGAVLLSRAGRDRRWVGNASGLGGFDDLDLEDAAMSGDPFGPARGSGPSGTGAPGTEAPEAP
jgi:hypothetical protein